MLCCRRRPSNSLLPMMRQVAREKALVRWDKTHPPGVKPPQALLKTMFPHDAGVAASILTAASDETAKRAGSTPASAASAATAVTAAAAPAPAGPPVTAPTPASAPGQHCPLHCGIWAVGGGQAPAQQERDLSAAAGGISSVTTILTDDKSGSVKCACRCTAGRVAACTTHAAGQNYHPGNKACPISAADPVVAQGRCAECSVKGMQVSECRCIASVLSLLSGMGGWVSEWVVYACVRAGSFWQREIVALLAP